MAWITPKVTWTPEPIYNADLNRIEGNIDYIYNTGIKPNTDASWTMGRGKLGTGTLTNEFWISHHDNLSMTNHAIRLTKVDTFINAPINGSIVFRSEGVDTLATLTNIEINLRKKTKVVGLENTSLLELNSGAYGQSNYQYTDLVSLSRDNNFVRGIRINTGSSVSSVGSNDIKYSIETIKTNDNINFAPVDELFSLKKELATILPPNEDGLIVMGRGKLGTGTLTNEFWISHHDNHTLQECSIRITTQDTLINAQSEGSVLIRNNGTNTLATFSSTAISLLKPTTISGALTCSTINTGHGANELYGMNQSVKTTNSVTFAGATINGHINPTTTPTRSHWDITTTAYTIPRGIYNIRLDDRVVIEMKCDDNVWRDLAVYQVGNQWSGTFVSDGSSLRIKTTTSSQTVYYQKY